MQVIAQRCSCPVCKETAQHDVYNVREMMFGLGDEFTYLQCNNCGCLYLKTKVEDLSEYYPKGYYSHKMDTLRKRNFLSLVLKRQRAKYAMSDSGWLGRTIARITGIPQYLLWIRKVGVSLHDAILDVGSGGGKLLLSMREDGFKNLMGVDPFIEEDVEYGGGVRICKKALSEIQGSFDFIMLNHSFEHMTEPHRALKEVYRL